MRKVECGQQCQHNNQKDRSRQPQNQAQSTKNSLNIHAAKSLVTLLDFFFGVKSWTTEIFWVISMWNNSHCDSKCWHFPPFSSRQLTKSFVVTSLREKCQRLAKRMWVSFLPLLSSAHNLIHSMTAKATGNRLVLPFKAVFSVSSMQPAKQSLRHLPRIS